MTSFRNEKVVCKCCNREYEGRFLRSWSQHAPVDLDLNPHNPAVYHEMVVCPHCGYVTARPHAEVKEEVSLAVKSAAYQKIWSVPQYNMTIKKLMAAAYLAEVEKDWKIAGTQYLKIVWYWNDLYLYQKMDPQSTRCELQTEKAREQAIRCFKNYLEATPDTECAILLVDLLRQSKHFMEAKETAESLEPYLEEKEFLLKILRYEQELILAKDDLPHSVSEV